MKKKISTQEFRQLFVKYTNAKNVDLIMEYLVDAGYVISSRDAEHHLVEVDSEFENKLEDMTKPINEGDIVWIDGIGLALVFIMHPDFEDDTEGDSLADTSKLFRAVKVNVVDGTYIISGSERSFVSSVDESIRIKHSGFDIERVKKLSTDRYNLIVKINEINRELQTLKENSNG